MSPIDPLARLLKTSRLATALLIGAITIFTGWGLVRGKPRPSWEDAEEGFRRSQPLEESSSFDLRGSDCFFVVEVADLYQNATVLALRDIVGRIEQLDYVAEVIWLDRVPATNVFGLPEPLLPREGASAAHFSDARRRIEAHPLVNGQLISRDGRTLLMPISFDWINVTSNEDVSKKLLQAALVAARDHPDAGLRIRLTGRVPLFVDYQEIFDRSHSRYMMIGMIVGFALALLIFRSLSPVLMVMSAPSLGLMWTLGALNLIAEPSNPLGNVVMPVLLIMVGMTDGVHLLTHIGRARQQGDDPVTAAVSGIRRVGLACFLTSITTAIGFGSLVLAKSEVIQGFGRACAIGVMITFLAVLTLIPLLSTTRLGRGLERIRGHQMMDRLSFGLTSDRTIEWIIDRRWPVAAVAVLLTALSALVAFQLRPDERMSSYQPEKSEAYQALRHCDRAFGGLEFIQVRVRWPRDLKSDAAKIVAAVRDVEEILKKEDLLSQPLSLNRLLASFPGDGELTERMSFVALLPPDLQRMFLDRRQQETIVISRVQDFGIRTYEPVFARIEQALDGLAKRHEGLTFTMQGTPVKRGRELYRIVIDLAASLGTASLIILAVMAIAYRSLRIGLITIIPNMFPLAVTGAVLYLIGQPLEVASVCSFTVCLGIAVDDTIHFLTRYQHESSSGEPAVAVRRTVRAIGGPLITTTIILVSGFATVLTSELPGQRIFAAMACATIGSALLGDLIFLPAMLTCFGKKKVE